MILSFNWNWSHLMNQLSLIRNRNFFSPEARISKWSKKRFALTMSIIRTIEILQVMISKNYKNWYYSYSNIPFICFNISITTCLCTAEFYLQMYQSNSFNGNDLMILLNWGWSCLLNKFLLIRSLNFFASDTKYQNDQNDLFRRYLKVLKILKK